MSETKKNESSNTIVYALSSFISTQKGQATLVEGQELELIDDSNSFWWLVKSPVTKIVYYFKFRKDMHQLN